MPKDHTKNDENGQKTQSEGELKLPLAHNYGNRRSKAFGRTRIVVASFQVQANDAAKREANDNANRTAWHSECDATNSSTCHGSCAYNVKWTGQVQRAGIHYR